MRSILIYNAKTAIKSSQLSRGVQENIKADHVLLTCDLNTNQYAVIFQIKDSYPIMGHTNCLAFTINNDQNQVIENIHDRINTSAPIHSTAKISVKEVNLKQLIDKALPDVNLNLYIQSSTSIAAFLSYTLNGSSLTLQYSFPFELHKVGFYNLKEQLRRWINSIEHFTNHISCINSGTEEMIQYMIGNDEHLTINIKTNEVEKVKSFIKNADITSFKRNLQELRTDFFENQNNSQIYRFRQMIQNLDKYLVNNNHKPAKVHCKGLTITTGISNRNPKFTIFGQDIPINSEKIFTSLAYLKSVGEYDNVISKFERLSLLRT